MRVEFHQAETPEAIVAVARWDGRRVDLEVRDDAWREALARVFRETPVVIDDAVHRRLGTHGEIVLEPGSLEWFRAAALTRGAEAGLVARFEPEVLPGAGWDPAADYRTFTQWVEGLESAGDSSY